MAVKERKQITGTTAQIQAYAGHEGQIVWDKEKKTLVGMSGTAGTNYPLAPKEYVDNEVAKCLPLSGGNISGQLHFGSVSRIQRIPDLNLLEICGGNEWNTGAVLRLYNNDNGIPSWEGACSMSSGLDDGLLIQNGVLSFNDLRVPTLISWHKEHIGVINGFSGSSKTFNFQPPKHGSRIVVPIIRTNIVSGYASVNFGFEVINSTSIDVGWWNNASAPTGDVWATIFFITEGGVRN